MSNSPKQGDTVLPPPPVVIADSKASPSPSPSPSSASQPSPLLTTLNRLSLSTSRPNLPPQEGYATRTLRNVSSSLQSYWDDSDSAQGSSAGIGSAGTPDKPNDGSAGIMRRASASLDTSAILYPTLENHPPPLAYPLLVLDLAALTSVPASISNEELLATLLNRLEPWVGEEGDGSGYCLIVLAAEDPEGNDKRALPGVAWWLWHWRRIPRKFRKNLKRLYIVHPSTMAKTLLTILLPILSPKSYAKLHTVPSLVGLARRGISLAGIQLPLVTLSEEGRVLRDNPEAARGSGNVVHPPPSWWGSVTSLLPWGYGEQQQGVPSERTAVPDSDETPYWSHDIDYIVEDSEGVPRALRDISAAILTHCAEVEGIFRRSPYTGLGTPLREFLQLHPSRQPRIDWGVVAELDSLLPPIMYKRLLAHLASPIIPTSLYPTIRRTKSVDDIKTLLSLLSPGGAAVLNHTIHMAHHLLSHEGESRMGGRSLAIVLAPALISGDPREDAMLCMEPGRTLPAGMASLRAAMGDSEDEEEEQGGNTLVGVLETYMTNYGQFAQCDGSGACDFAAPIPVSRPRAWNRGSLAPPVET